MKVLIADDDHTSRIILEKSLVKWGYEVISVPDGVEAWQRCNAPDPPKLVILDWMMPGMDGIEVCRRVREKVLSKPSYIILLTARNAKEDIVVALEAGADDYITKPFDFRELGSRVKVGQRVIELQCALKNRVMELEDALSKVKQLQGLLPICSYCKKIRNDENYWQEIEKYIVEHSGADFSHGICPDCYAKVASEFERLKASSVDQKPIRTVKNKKQKSVSSRRRRREHENTDRRG